jgi:hypothetical protein
VKNEEAAEKMIADNRSHVRMCCEPTLVYVHLADYNRPVNAQMIDVSKGGLQLQLNQPLPVGTYLTIDTGQVTLHGEVRHCQEQPGHVFVIGVMKRDS